MDNQINSKNFKLGSYSRLIVFSSILLLIFTIQSCSGTKKTATKEIPENQISWQTNILPVLQASCAPCHFPETGKKKMLDTYEATRGNVDDILRRIQLSPSHEEYMPFKSKKPALTAEELAMFKEWVSQKMPR